MNILLVQPPHQSSSGKREPTAFPLGLGIIARILNDAGHSIKILDIWASDLNNDQAIKKVKTINFDAIGISAMSTQYLWVLQFVTEIRKFFKGPIVLGGLLATLNWKFVFKNIPIDICVIGEGEITAKELFDNMDNLENIRGIYYRKNKKIIQNPPRELIKDLDSIPYPAYDLWGDTLNVYRNSIFVRTSNIPAWNIISGRGCPYNCYFCSKSFPKVRLRSIDAIIKEINFLINKFGIKGVFFNDELLIVNRKRIYELCDHIKPLKLKWNCQGRVNLVNLDILRKMKNSGCVAVGYGIESGSQRILDNMNKRTTVEQGLIAIKNTYKVKLSPVIQVMFGYPGEDEDSIKETVDFFYKANVGRISFFVVTPIPGTRLYEQALEQGLIQDEEKYLLYLDAGYLSNRQVLVNFTNWSDDVFHKKKKDLEDQIWNNYVNKSFRNKINAYFYYSRNKSIIEKIRIPLRYVKNKIQ